MMHGIVASSLKFRRLLLAVAAAVLFFGVVQLRKAPVDALPEFKPVQVELQTEALGLSAKEVEQIITVPLEQDLLAGVAFLDHMESASLPGLSDVVLTFEPGTSLLDARQVVSERLTQVAGLPGVAKPPEMIQPTSSTSRAAIIELSTTKLTPIQMSVLARWVITPRLLGVPGVAHVDIWGQRDRQLQVLVDPKKLRAEGVTLDQIVRTTGNSLDVSPLSFIEAANPGTGGFIDMLNQRLQVFHEQAITNAKQLGEVSIEGREGSTGAGPGRRLSLKDVSTVVEDHQPLIGDALCSGPNCVLLVIQKFPGANSVEVTQGVDTALDAMRPGLGGIQIDSSVYRPSAYVERSFSHLGRALLIGGILMVLLLWLFFFNWRTTLISTVVVLVSLAAAGLVLYFRGTSFNTMVVAGLVMALVAVVDDAVIDAENIGRRLRRHRLEGDGAPTWRIVLDASLEMRRPILFATLIAFVAIIPVFFTKDAAGAFLPPMAISFMLAVAVSMAIALTLAPALSLLLLPSAAAEGRESPAARWLQRSHERASSRIARRPAPAFMAAGALLIAGLIALPFLGEALSPNLRENDLVVRLAAAPGTSLPAMDRITAQAASELRNLSGVRGVGAQVGRAFTSDRAVNVNHGEVWVNLDSSTDYNAAVARVERVADGLKQSLSGLSVDVATYSEEQTKTFLPGSADDLIVRVYGEEPQVLRSKAEEIRRAVTRISGVQAAEVQLPVEEPNIEVKVNLGDALRYGVKPGDVRRSSAILLSGITVGNLFQEQKVFDVVVWGRPEIRQSVADVQNLLIDTPRGRLVPLSKMADVRVANNPAIIRHDGTSSYLDVAVDVSGRSASAVAADADRAVKQIQFPLEHHAEVLGNYADRQTARTRLLAIALAAAIGVFLLLQAALGSWRVVLLSFSTILLAVAGALVAAWVAGGKISLGSVGGLLAVITIATRHVVLLVRHYQDLERRDGQSFGADLVLSGTRNRLPAITTATVATVGILIPLMLSGTGPGFEIVQPMAVVILGGLLTAALVNLLITPALYLRYGFTRQRDTSADDLFADLPDVDLTGESEREAEEARR